MNKYNKYIAASLLVVFSTTLVVNAEEENTPALVNVRSSTDLEVMPEIQKLRLDQEALRKSRNEDLVKLRFDTKAKIQSGDINRSEAMKELNAQSKEQREETRMEMKDVRESFKTSLKDEKIDLRLLLKVKREAIIEAIQNKRDSFKQEFEIRREEMQAKRLEIKTEFKANLLKIKDESKRDRIENITNNFAELNIKFTTRASNIVDEIETALVTIESRADKAEANGSAVVDTRASILNAENAIAEARVAIALQISRVYSPSISSDTDAKSSVSKTNEIFKADIKTMNTKIKAAYDQTLKAYQSLKVIPNVDVEISTNTNITNN